jgi:hypothetical protein
MADKLQYNIVRPGTTLYSEDLNRLEKTCLFIFIASTEYDEYIKNFSFHTNVPGFYIISDNRTIVRVPKIYFYESSYSPINIKNNCIIM